MIEKVNPSHPDKVADRIAGAIVDLAYKTEHDPKIAVEVLIGHGKCHVIIETTAVLDEGAITAAIHRIAGNVDPDIMIVPQDAHLSEKPGGGPALWRQRNLQRCAADSRAETALDHCPPDI